MHNIPEVLNPDEITHHGLVSLATNSVPIRVFTAAGSSTTYLGKLYKLLGYKSYKTAKTLDEYGALPVIDMNDLPQGTQVGVLNNSEFIIADRVAIQNYNSLQEYLSSKDTEYNYDSGGVNCDEVVIHFDDQLDKIVIIDLNSEWAQVLGISEDSGCLIVTPIEIIKEFQDPDSYSILHDIIEDDYEPDDYSSEYSKFINAKDLKDILISLKIITPRRQSYAISDSHSLAKFDIVSFVEEITRKTDTELSSINTDVTIHSMLSLVNSIMSSHQAKYLDIQWIYKLIHNYNELQSVKVIRVTQTTHD